MTNSLTTTQQTNLITFDDSQVDLIKRTIAKGATDDEMALFLHQAKRMGLDPLARQIHFQKYTSNNGSSNVSFITTIDGYRLVADRTGRYAGNDEPVFEGSITIPDVGQYDHISKAPAKATVTVYKVVAENIRPFSASAYWEEYYPRGKKGHMWRKMPHVMLAKCAEALALRKAFPADLSGVYTREEMEQSDYELITPSPVLITNTPTPQPETVEWDDLPSATTPTDKQRKQFHAIGKKLYGDEWDDKRAVAVEWVTKKRTKSSRELTSSEMQTIIDELESRTPPSQPPLIETPQPLNNAAME